MLVAFEGDYEDGVATHTDAAGKFKLGPLEEATEKKLVLTKPNYSFSAGAAYGQFVAHELASITVEVQDEAKKLKLKDVVISLSGGENNFRNISKTQEDGKIEFTSLIQGDYFLKAYLKEWNFTPKNHGVTVSAGQHLKLDFTGQRVAYTARGVLTHVNGKQEAGLVLIAVSEGCDGHREDATTDATGKFELSGLKPGCEYKLEPGSASGLDKILMPQPSIKVDKEDVTLTSPALALKSNDMSDVAVIIKEDPKKVHTPTTFTVTFKNEEGASDFKVHKSLSVKANEPLFIPRIVPISQTDSYIIMADGQTQTYTPTENFHLIEFQATPPTSKDQGDNVPDFSLIVPLVIAGLSYFYYTRYYQAGQK